MSDAAVAPQSTPVPAPTSRGVHVVEVGPRDGLQNERAVLDVDTRVELVRRLVGAGVRRLETVSFVNPKRVPQMAGAEEVMAAVPRTAPDGSHVDHIGLVLNERGLDRALAAGVDEVNLVAITTETFSRRNQGAGVDDVLAATVRMLERARAAGVPASVTVSAAFGCPFEGEVGTEQVMRVVRAVLPGEPVEVAIADTIGVGVPADVRRLVRAVRAESDVPLRAHFHNTRNTGYANALTAAEEGVLALDASIGGYGGCPFAPNATGNIGTEDLVYALGRSGVDVGLRVADLADPCDYVTAALGADRAPALLGRAGDFPG
ncbi:hydroxymethylglutaryl-CoA lyase [Aquipuribacter sp. MA13-6]|uniref:hydroxymethylglutaryl-CoA lyase n=1 Tax=unclassified Aquipuribacter TaxID=2635084 RepID=UPI003EE83819